MRNFTITDEIRDDAADHGSRPADDVVRRLRAATQALGAVAGMQIGDDQGQPLTRPVTASTGTSWSPASVPAACCWSTKCSAAGGSSRPKSPKRAARMRAPYRAYASLGVHAFSVFEVPDHDFEELARLEPILRSRPKLLEASGPDLLTAGFPLLPTASHPHRSVVLSEPTAAQFTKVRAHFHGREPVTTDPALGLGSADRLGAQGEHWAHGAQSPERRPTVPDILLVRRVLAGMGRAVTYHRRGADGI
jgi:hypothetical protein